MNHEKQFDPPRIILVKEEKGAFDFALLPQDFKRFEHFHMLCAGLVVRTGAGFDLLSSERYMLPAETSAVAMRQWQERAIGYVHSQWNAYVSNGFKLPGCPKQQEAFDEMVSHSVRNLGPDVMSEKAISELESSLHAAFMRMLDLKMGLPSKEGLTGRYAMGGKA